MVGQVFIVRLSGNSHLITVEQSAINEEFDHSGCATNVLNILHDILSRWFEVCQEWGNVRNTLKIIQGNRNLRILTRTTHGNQMKNRISRSTRHHHHTNGILKSSLGHDIPWLNILLQQNLHRITRRHALINLLLRIGRGARRVGKRHAQGFDRRGHGVRRVHSPARSRSGTAVLDDFLPFLLADFIVERLSVGLEGAHDVEGVSGAGLFARSDGSAIHHDARSVQPAHGHDDAGHVLVAPRQSNEAIVPLSAHGSLNRISDQITGLE
mmetsp:Transcript_15868/g.34326  ORF Transcript_15868/g.34326 Transcript_15868/m.34326 type:complete len:268 (+) Transcript_15868:905-1708(+)